MVLSVPDKKFDFQPSSIFKLISLPIPCCYPGDFVTNVTQISSQSDLISMSSFAGPSYLTIRSSVYMILV